MTQIASVLTTGPTLRHEIVGWTYEDSDLLVNKRADDGKIIIGNTPSLKPRDVGSHDTVLEMLADGWKLLAPPSDESWTNEDGTKIEEWGWWLTREDPRRMAR